VLDGANRYAEPGGFVRVDCDGFGRRIVRRGRPLYTHFDGDIGSTVSPEWVTLHVLGNHRFKIT
jgi:hypothetical protein